MKNFKMENKNKKFHNSNNNIIWKTAHNNAINV